MIEIKKFKLWARRMIADPIIITNTTIAILATIAAVLTILATVL